MANSLFDSLFSSMKDLTNGQGAGDLAGRAKTAWGNQSTLTKGAIAGGLLGILLSGNARRALGTGVKVGGAALIGGLAYKAYEDWKKGRAAADDASSPDEAPPLPDDTMSERLLQAMIAAAKADGQITAEERAKIADALPQLGLGDEAQAMISAELDAPLDVAVIAGLATNPQQAAEIYAASLLAINPDGPAEKGYLAMLAARLKLDAELVDHLHSRARALA